MALKIKMVDKFLFLFGCRCKCGQRSNPFSPAPRRPDGIQGFSLLEIMITFCIIATLASIATMSYAGYRTKVTIQLSIVEIHLISKEIDRFRAQNDDYPDSLSDLAISIPNDPWGNPYRYLKIDGVDFKGKGKPKDKRRKDHEMVPVNNDYDLYSMGPDGDSRAPFTAQASRDDIVRVQNGKFVGLASDY
jgi:general secretion pathway protein G